VRRAAIVTLMLLAAAAPALAQVNYGDFLGTSVDFLQVTETTQTAGDPAVLWGTPTVIESQQGDLLQLQFFPPAFISSCAVGSIDTTSSLLTTTIFAHGTNTIDTVTLVESGDVTLTKFPPFGDPTTNASASLSGFLTVIEDTGGPIAPVVIPFSGTFVPTSTFSLPGHFGTNLWNGTMTVDVVSQVPNATKAILQLDNDLATNCGAGNTSGKIQKKVVSGPAAAIMINEPTCSVAIEKTCCVPQPALVNGSICDGKAIRAVFEVVGGDCEDTTNTQGGEAKCSGPNPILDDDPVTGDTVSVAFRKDGDKMSATPSTGLAVGDTFEIVSISGPTLVNQLKLLVTREDPDTLTQNLEVHVSCSRALRCGDQFGSLKLVEFESELGGTVVCTDPEAPQTATRCVAPPAPTGTPCDSKLTEAVFRFNPSDCQDPLANPQGGTASCNGDASDANLPVAVTYVGKQPDRIRVEPASNIAAGDTFRLSATGRKDFHPNVKLLITDDNSVEQSISIHTSCSQPLACGDVFGSLTLIGFSTKDGLEVECDPAPPASPFADACEVPVAPPTPHCTSKLKSLTLVYLQDAFGSTICDVSNPQGGAASCTGQNLTADSVAITLTKDVTELTVDTPVSFGGYVTIAPIDPDGQLPSSIEFDATGQGPPETQSLVIHTSCSKPLNLGDRFGDFAVLSMEREGDGIISLGGAVEYQYKVSNPNGAQITVAVEDDKAGNIVSGETLEIGEQKTFYNTQTLDLGALDDQTLTLTNTAHAHAELAGGEMCDSDYDQAMVSVTLPPPGPYECEKPYDRIGMIWKGTGNIKVKKWRGDVGSTGDAVTATVMPGDEVMHRNLTFAPNDVVWEIFDAATMVKLGESKFHLSCSDSDLNGLEDCGKPQGDGKSNDPTLISTWELERVVDAGGKLNCTPDEAAAPIFGCGIGFELILVLPPILWLHRRRRRTGA